MKLKYYPRDDLEPNEPRNDMRFFPRHELKRLRALIKPLIPPLKDRKRLEAQAAFFDKYRPRTPRAVMQYAAVSLYMRDTKRGGPFPCIDDANGIENEACRVLSVLLYRVPRGDFVA